MKNLFAIAVAGVLALLPIFGGEAVADEEKVRVGVLEEVILMPYGIRLPARVDTGAAMCSLDARDIRSSDGRVEFRLPKTYGGMKFHLPIVEWRTIRSAESREKRPVVELEFCLGPKRVKTLVNLNNRSRVRYPLIIGRNLLSGNFVVDCMATRCAPPECGGDATK
jgi:hypothetical protein